MAEYLLTPQLEHILVCSSYITIPRLLISIYVQLSSDNTLYLTMLQSLKHI